MCLQPANSVQANEAAAMPFSLTKLYQTPQLNFSLLDRAASGVVVQLPDAAHQASA